MSNFREINLEKNMPSLEEAMDNLKASIQMMKRQKVGCVLVIHGYGSTGKGGIIGRRARKWLKTMEEQSLVKTVIYGENFEIFNFKALELKNKYPELTPLLRVCNHGVTVVEL